MQWSWGTLYYTAQAFIISLLTINFIYRSSPDMAEDDVTPEQLAAIAAENDEPEAVNYKAPAQKTLQEIHELDKDDESLRKYKETLLGPGISQVGNVCVERREL